MTNKDNIKVEWVVNNNTLTGRESIKVTINGTEFEKDKCSSLLLFAPPLRIQVEDFSFDFKKPISVESKEHKEFLVTVLGRKVFCFDGMLLHPEEDTINDSAKFFRELLILLNILGIPINMLETSLFVLFFVFPKNQLNTTFVKEGNKSLLHLPKIEIGKEKSELIIDSVNKLHSKIQSNKFLQESEVYEYLAKAYNAYCHKDFRSSFIHSWIFIEAIISKIWEENIIKIHGSKKSAKGVVENRVWTTYIKIEELFLIGKLTKEEIKTINELRKKRNEIFHLGSKKANRRILMLDAHNCCGMALELFYKELNLDYHKDADDFPEIRRKILSYIDKNLPDTNEILGLPPNVGISL